MEICGNLRVKRENSACLFPVRPALSTLYTSKEKNATEEAKVAVSFAFSGKGNENSIFFEKM